MGTENTRPLIDWTIAERGSTSIRIDARRTGDTPVSRFLTGKFCEHLGDNIYNGMDAQIVRNHRFGPYPFSTRRRGPDGGMTHESDPEAVRSRIRETAASWGWPPAAMEGLVGDYESGLALGWTRWGRREAVRVSPDTGQSGQRAQRVEAPAGSGIAQWTWLPLHRVRRFVFEIAARSPEPGAVRIAIADASGVELDAVKTRAVAFDWEVLRGELSLPEGADADAPVVVTITGVTDLHIVLTRFTLLPADHIDGFDPDIVRHLRDARLPLLRWPGGNFVSDYRFEHGIGPVDLRPIGTNPAWGGVEPNSFGTDEFIGFCRAVGCEPLVCLNAGTGTPEEAARWVEYCNGPADSAMGRIRAASGHPEAYRVVRWEVGNELAGTHQRNWSTPRGYADRYRRFRSAMVAVDPAITVYANGSQIQQGDEWNRTLYPYLATTSDAVSDHPLVGALIEPVTDPVAVYRDFMAYPLAYERRHVRMDEEMRAAGVAAPRIAITELQEHAKLAPVPAGVTPAISADSMVDPRTLSEALYATLFFHAAVRLSPLVELITHSATVNHGGGLRKERERVYRNPVHHASRLFRELDGALPLAVRISTPHYRPALVLADFPLVDAPPEEVPEVDALAVTLAGDIVISIVHRGHERQMPLSIEAAGVELAGEAEVTTIAGPLPWERNSVDDPDRVAPTTHRVAVLDGRITIDLPPHSVCQVRARVAR